MYSDGTVWTAGQIISSAYLPSSSIIQPDLFKQRGYEAFTAGDEVVVTLDCSAHTLRLQSPTVDHTISMEEQHHNPQQQWVLNVNFWGGGEFEVKLTYSKYTDRYFSFICRGVPPFCKHYMILHQGHRVLALQCIMHRSVWRAGYADLATHREISLHAARTTLD